jgi:hypothetical protein
VRDPDDDRLAAAALVALAMVVMGCVVACAAALWT